ncbi:alpha-ribazole phosphatase [Porphyromonadaceae bacterium OttesenSCG-928-L07]|nr:alpha-ribazole phosphatase [Porphyromonadaceae bacterium OttesenSCG-928-L07]MDL2252136.1 alpha-ribazole phosphatase [Odoribacter sp. OttesenSCG-928-J03]MDL2330526.1 alpha-ribazole phosphatase [Odoribacter sp. OttesenSCG-928-A06]
MNIFLIRHTSVDVPKGICYGQTDVPLNQSFESEASVVKQKLSAVPFDAIFSSPLSRCTRLAEYCEYTDIQLSDHLKELNFGDWEMQCWDELDMSCWKTDWVSIPPPNGESFLQMNKRVASFFENLKKKDYENVAIFAHGGVFSCVKVYLGLTDIEHAFVLNAEYGEVWEFELI